MNHVIASEWLWRRSKGMLAALAASVAGNRAAGRINRRITSMREGRLERPAGGITGEHARGLQSRRPQGFEHVPRWTDGRRTSNDCRNSHRSHNGTTAEVATLDPTHPTRVI
jgi:hypothetical protein